MFVFLIREALKFMPLDIEHQQLPRTKQAGGFTGQQAKENNSRPMD